MGSLLGSAAAAGSCYSVVGRISTGIFRSPNTFGSCNLGACFHHRKMSPVNSADVSPSIMSPRLMLPPAFEGGDMVYQFYNLAEYIVESLNRRSKEEESGELELPDDDVKFVGSSHGWLALCDSRNNNLCLSNPVTRRHIKLPPIHTLPGPRINSRYCRFTVSKVILSRSPHEEECRAVMSLGPGNRLAFCLPGCTTDWTPFGDFSHEIEYHYEEFESDEDEEDYKVVECYDDFVYSARHKLFFCITNTSYLQGWNLHDLGSPRMEWSDWIDWLEGEPDLREILRKSNAFPEVMQQRYLVFDECSSQLFLVRRHIMVRVGHDGSYVRPIYFGFDRGWDDSYPYKTFGFDVHKVDLDECGKTKVTYMKGSLDGLVMFVGLNHSFAISAAEFPELKPNSIYFTDTINETITSKRVRWGEEERARPGWVDMIYGGHDIGIFNYENRTFSPCYYPCDVQSIKRITPPPIWFI